MCFFFHLVTNLSDHLSEFSLSLAASCPKGIHSWTRSICTTRCETVCVGKRHKENVVFCFADERDRVQKKTFTKWVNKHLITVRVFSSLSHCLYTFYSQHTPRREMDFYHQNEQRIAALSKITTLRSSASFPQWQQCTSKSEVHCLRSRL